MKDIIRSTPYAFSWLSTRQVCQRWDAYYAAINWENHNAPPYTYLQNLTTQSNSAIIVVQ